MKKIIYLFLGLLIFACSSDDSSGNSDGVDYFFEVEFGAVVNRVEGNSSYELFVELPSWLYGNQCYGSTASVTLSISDITGEDYVSGQNMSIAMSFDNAQLGSNTVTITNFGGFYIEEYLASLGVDEAALFLGGFIENEPTSWV